MRALTAHLGDIRRAWRWAVVLGGAKAAVVAAIFAAIALAEKFVDDGLRGGQEIVFFVHGHGTGALRAALREHFRAFPGVNRMRPGEPGEGGDGVTVLILG